MAFPKIILLILSTPTYNNLLKVAVDFSDAVILAAENIPSELQEPHFQPSKTCVAICISSRV